MTIRTLQVPSHGVGAFNPIPWITPEAATNGQNRVVNSLGTVPVPSPRPASMSLRGLYGRFFQGSDNSPGWFLPVVGVVFPNLTMKFPGRLFGHRPTPVPAAAIGVAPRVAPMGTRLGGRTVTANPKPYTQWPTYGG